MSMCIRYLVSQYDNMPSRIKTWCHCLFFFRTSQRCVYNLTLLYSFSLIVLHADHLVERLQHCDTATSHDDK